MRLTLRSAINDSNVYASQVVSLAVMRRARELTTLPLVHGRNQVDYLRCCPLYSTCGIMMLPPSYLCRSVNISQAMHFGPLCIFGFACLSVALRRATGAHPPQYHLPQPISNNPSQGLHVYAPPTRMLLRGMWINLTTYPTKPMIRTGTKKSAYVFQCVTSSSSVEAPDAICSFDAVVDLKAVEFGGGIKYSRMHLQPTPTACEI